MKSTTVISDIKNAISKTDNFIFEEAKQFFLESDSPHGVNFMDEMSEYKKKTIDLVTSIINPETVKNEEDLKHAIKGTSKVYSLIMSHTFKIILKAIL